MSSFESGAAAVCPECGALAPLVQGWLQVHREGSAEYAYPRGQEYRCKGSLLPGDGLVSGSEPLPRTTSA
jgi:adenine-specific DNA methylase